MKNLMNLKDLWIAGAAVVAIGACAAGEQGSDAPATAGTEQAVTGDFANMASRYNWSLTGNSSFEQAVIGLKVASGDFATLIQMVKDETGIDITSQLTVVDRNNLTASYPGTTDQAELEKVAEAISGLLVADRSAPIRFFDCTAADSTNHTAAYTHLPSTVGVVTATFTAGSQSSITTFLANHTGIVPVVPNGFLASSQAVQVGMTQDSAGSDVKWTSGDGGDIMALGHSIPLPTATGDWVSSPKDSPYFAAGAIAGRLNNQSGAPATRSVLLGAAGSHFTLPTGSGSTLGIFKDGATL